MAIPPTDESMGFLAISNMKRLRSVHCILLVSLLSRILLYFIQAHPVWWDTAVYASMGKYIFSLGKVGLWEPIRPLVFPLLMGVASRFSPQVVLLWGVVLELSFSLGLVYVTYLVGKELFGERVGLLASVLVSFTPFFFYFSFIPLSGIPSAFFAVLAVYFFIKGRDIAAGIFLGVAVMTRFPQGLVLIAMLVLCSRVKRFFRIGLAFSLALLPYFILNFVLYNDPFLPFIEGDGVIATAGLWLFQGEWYYYIAELVKDNVLFLFAVVGVALSRTRRHFCVTLPLLLMFAYFSMLAHKELRFALVFLPYLSIVTAYGLCSFVKGRRVFCLLMILVVVIFAHGMRLETSAGWQASLPFYTLLEGEDIRGEILTSNPLIGLYTDAKLKPLYYPVFDSGHSLYWIDYIENSRSISYIFIDTCNGLLCAPDDEGCIEMREELIATAEENYEEVFYKKGEGCYYKTFKSLAL